MGGVFWQKIGLWSKRPDQLPENEYVLFISVPQVPSTVAGSGQELGEGLLTEGGQKGL